MNKDALKIFYKGVNSFNDKKFYDAHEYFEEIWIEHDLDDRLFVQGLIQLSVAFFHITNRNRNGAMGLFKKSISKLNRYLDTSQLVVNINDVIKSVSLFKSWAKLSHLAILVGFFFALAEKAAYLSLLSFALSPTVSVND